MMRIVIMLISFALIAVAAHANPIRLHPIKVTASSTYPGSNPLSALDGDSSTAWSAGDKPTQWVQLDLGRVVSIRKIHLQVAQPTAGTTHHIVAVGQDESQLSDVKEFHQVTSDGQWLEYALGEKEFGHVRFLRITTDQGPAIVGWKEIEIYQGLEYFAYYGDAISWNGKGNYIEDTTRNGANLVWIGGKNIEEYQDKLLEAQTRGAKVVLDIGYQLFVLEENDKDLGRLRPDWKARWNKIVSIIRRSPNTVVAFYACDEPYSPWNGSRTASDRAAMKENLQRVALQIRWDFPTTPIALIISVPELMEYDLDSSYVSMADWVGFDCYRSWEDCHMPTLITKLRSWLRPEQRMIAVPWAFEWGRDSGTGFAMHTREERLQNIENWKEEIVSDAKYVSLVPFLWQTMDLDGDGKLESGTEDMPTVKEELKKMVDSLLPFSGNE